MKMKLLLTSVLLVTLFAFSSVFAQSYNYEEMTQEQYNAYLQEWQSRLDAAQEGIDQENATIDELNKELEDLQSQNDGTWNEIYNLAESDEAGYNDFTSGLNGLKNDASALLNLSPEDIYRRMDEIDEMQAKFDEMKNNPFAAMTENERAMNQIESMLAQAREKGKPAVPPTYTVMRGDYLWKIAGKEDVYNDAYAWMKIYTYNRDQIKNPDLIYPDQVFNIPREVGINEHWVAKGEYLSRIAGYSNVYGSPFQWQKLYDANKELISDPNMIYPHMVLKIAR